MIADLAPFKGLIQRHCGLTFDGVGERLLTVALAKRIAAGGGAVTPGHAASYYARLCADDGELGELVSLLTINETYFFREPEQLELLTGRLLPRLLADRPARPIRILSAGCSTGEEPYSIVMALQERFGAAAERLFEVAGGDIDHQALAKAREGRYTPFSFRGVDPRLRDRYFAAGDDGDFRVGEAIRRAVALHPLNLLADGLPLRLGTFDVIFFRNVSIYLDEPARRAILQRLAGLLSDGGYLILGSAETLANDLGVLPLIEEEGAFYFAKGAAAAAPAGPPPPRPRPATPPPTVAADFAAARRLAADKRHDEALALCERLAAAQPADPRPHLLRGHLLAERRDWGAARAAAERALALEEWSLDGLFLLGLIAHREGDGAAAVRRLKQALYARSDCWPAHYYLAERYRADGEEELARREYRIAGQQLAQSAAGAGDPGGGIAAFPLGLPLAELRLLCERRGGAGHAERRAPG